MVISGYFLKIDFLKKPENQNSFNSRKQLLDFLKYSEFGSTQDLKLKTVGLEKEGSRKEMPVARSHKNKRIYK